MSEAVVAAVLMVIVAVVEPLGTGYTDAGLSEQAGEVACLGCTEQESEIGCPDAFKNLTVTVDLALCPRETVLGAGADAEIRKSTGPVSSRRGLNQIGR